MNDDLFAESLLAFKPIDKPTQINRMPNRIMPTNPRNANSSIGGAPRTKIGSSGSSSQVSDLQVSDLQVSDLQVSDLKVSDLLDRIGRSHRDGVGW
jgi:hypothetical protein